MKKTLPFLLVSSLLIGIVVTLITSRVSNAEVIRAPDCGFSVNSKTRERTQLTPCIAAIYGWPIKYITGGAYVVLFDYHTEVPNDPANASSFIGYTSISRLRFSADWLLWSAVAGLVLIGLSSATNNNSKSQKTSRKKK